uniref:Uncharacterized protein n=1 Tax=Anguilla anguilla TaxID=7936 RepID=A0A0E9U2X1_ANGAN
MSSDSLGSGYCSYYRKWLVLLITIFSCRNSVT